VVLAIPPGDVEPEEAVPPPVADGEPPLRSPLALPLPFGAVLVEPSPAELLPGVALPAFASLVLVAGLPIELASTLALLTSVVSGVAWKLPPVPLCKLVLLELFLLAFWEAVANAPEL
jgi:hypothetical protein